MNRWPRRSSAEPPENISSELFEISFRNAPIGIAIVDPSGHWLNVNDALCRIVGYTREELLSGSFQDITHPADLDSDLTLMRDTLAGQRDGYRIEKRYIHKDAGVIWGQLTTSLVRNADGTPRCFISHVEDITSVVRDRENLKKLSERLQLATSAASIGVIDYDITRRRGHADGHLRAIYEIDASPGTAMDFSIWRARIHPEDTKRLLRGLRQTRRTGAPLDTTHRIVLPSGTEKMLHFTARIFFGKEGRATRCIAVTRDITPQHHASEELRTARDAAEAANRAKSAFLAVMSHEIRTPLHGIVGHCHLLAETNISPEQSTHLATILSSGDALLAIIEDILDYSKIEAGKLQLKAGPLSLRRCVEASMAALQPRADAKRLNFRAEVAASVPDMVIGDHIRLRQVLINLLANAVKFTTQGTVRLSVTSEATSPGNHVVHFQVSDTGIGIPADRVRDVFKPFRQLDDSITRRFGGTGLGLSICEQLVSTMGGTITVSSHPDHGTEIDVSVPMTLSSEEQPEISPLPPARRPVRGGVPSFSPDVSALRILVAEDNRVNRQLVQLILQRAGSQSVETVEDGQDAVDRLESGEIDVVLMDCEMPRLDGYEATRRIRSLEQENPARPRVSIIALTAGAFPEHRQRAIEVGMDDFLTKPLRPDALTEALERCVRTA